MKSVETFIGKRVALVDRGFVIAEGRIVYPTAEGVLEAVDNNGGTLSLRIGNDALPTLFFRDALRCIREAPQAPVVPEQDDSEAVELAEEG